MDVSHFADRWLFLSLSRRSLPTDGACDGELRNTRLTVFFLSRLSGFFCPWIYGQEMALDVKMKVSQHIVQFVIVLS